jgi:hypothetical protein
MNARIFVAASFVSALTGTLQAADPQLLKLVMPDVKVMSDINVAQIKVTPFGQYVISRLGNSEVPQFTVLTGFDPAKDLTELLCASNGTPNTGLALATGIFDPTKIAALATQDGAVTEAYAGVTILEDPQKAHGVAFLNAGLMAAGDVAGVKAAIDRQTAPTKLSKDLTDEINMLSNSEDAWALTTAPPSSMPHTNAKNPQEVVGGMTVPPNVLQQVQSGWGGVKFGSNIVITAQAQTVDAQTATNLAGMAQLLQNIALMQSQKDPNLAAFAKSISVTASGTAVNLSASVSEETFQALSLPRAKAGVAHKK